MNRLPFTKYASKALNEGREIAGYLGFKDVSSIFVLLGLYGADGSLASEVLKMHGVTRELIEEAIKEKSKMPKDRRRTVMDTPKTEYLLEIAGELAMKYGCEAIGSEHILMAMIKDGDNEAFRFLEDHKISSEGIYTDILVTAGIDFSKIMIDIDEDTKIITITLPESEIQNTTVDFGSMDYIFENKKYALTVHGFARDYEFSLLKKTENSVIYELIYNDESLKVYPFKFSLQLEYVLLENGLQVNYTVKNLEDANKDIFFALGLHTAYNCPLEKTDDFEDYELIFEQKETAKRHFLSNGIINNETADLLNDEDTLAISKKLFEKDLILLKQIKSKYVTLKSKKSGKFVRVYFNNFNNVGFWTKPQGASFVCIEPWNGLPDVKDKYVDFSEKEEICKLKSNEEFNCSYKIEIK